MTNYEKAQEIYEKGGQFDVYDAVNLGELKADYWDWCEPCDDHTPYEGNVCLVCGTRAKEK